MDDSLLHCYQEQIEKLLRLIVGEVNPVRVILFGSAARGEFGPESDVDVLVVMPEGTHRRHTAQKLYREIKGITIPFDIVVATPGDLEKHRDNPGLIYKTILEEGRTIYAA
ncbi:MAG TPA: nucleotidyltransferase domain-containing protein [bacterium]|nr:nucleotidyltransferase domain-containing protein [bacterium]